MGTLQENCVDIATQACTAKQNRFKGLGQGEQKTTKYFITWPRRRDPLDGNAAGADAVDGFSSAVSTATCSKLS